MKRTLVCGITAAVWLTAAAYGTTIYVDDDAPGDPGPGDPAVSDPSENGTPEHPFDTIQEGIDGAVDGDTVMVADGTYTGEGNKNLDCQGKAITVCSASGNPDACVIDCENDGRGFYFHSEESVTSVVDGFTITNGYAELGGAIYCTNGDHPRIQNCVITQNVAHHGGGIYRDANGSFYCVGVHITNNTAEAYGGGVSSYGGGGGNLVECVIAGNTAGWGGGVFGMGGWVGTVSCMISGNTAEYAGGGIFQESVSSPLPVNCIVSGNTATWYGGGLCYEGCTSVQITNGTIVDNGTDWLGGGIYVSDTNVLRVFNTILAANSANYGLAIAAEVDSLVEVAHSDVYSEDPVYVTGGSFVVWGDGVLYDDPLFVDPENGDFRLRFDSPCVDTGSNDLIPPDSGDLDGDGDTDEPIPFDLDGGPRVARFTVDMGAYEIPFADMNCDGAVSFFDIDPFVQAVTDPDGYVAAHPECDLLLADCNADGAVNFFDIEAFVELVTGG